MRRGPNAPAGKPAAAESAPPVTGRSRRCKASTAARSQRAGRPTPIDRFVAARRRAAGLSPVRRADRRTLIRRVTFDLIGLPPTPEEIADFLADQSPDAFSRVVDRLLASPHYGEQWGRHWMDVVRYADTAGDNADYPIPEAVRYRDYIIDSCNADKPYDRMVREHLAGDILARNGPAENYAESVIATGFLALSRRYATAPFELWHLDARRHDRHDRPGVSGADAALRALPRPQVRPGHASATITRFTGSSPAPRFPTRARKSFNRSRFRG